MLGSDWFRPGNALQINNASDGIESVTRNFLSSAEIDKAWTE